MHSSFSALRKTLRKSTENFPTFLQWGWRGSTQFALNKLTMHRKSSWIFLNLKRERKRRLKNSNLKIEKNPPLFDVSYGSILPDYSLSYRLEEGERWWNHYHSGTTFSNLKFSFKFSRKSLDCLVSEKYTKLSFSDKKSDFVSTT